PTIQIHRPHKDACPVMQKLYQVMLQTGLYTARKHLHIFFLVAACTVTNGCAYVISYRKYITATAAKGRCSFAALNQLAGEFFLKYRIQRRSPDALKMSVSRRITNSFSLVI